ncbi:MAG: hypothetical protein QXJ62_03885 [Nitrososphaeria archaeon]
MIDRKYAFIRTVLVAGEYYVSVTTGTFKDLAIRKFLLDGKTVRVDGLSLFFELDELDMKFVGLVARVSPYNIRFWKTVLRMLESEGGKEGALAEIQSALVADSLSSDR